MEEENLKIKTIVIVTFFVLSLTIGLAPVHVDGIDLGNEVVIWNTTNYPGDTSDHTRCEVLFAKGYYWLYFDWVPEGGGNPDIYMMKSRNAADWSSPQAVVSGPDNEQDPRVLFYGGTFHLTFLIGDVLYIQTSTDGEHFGGQRVLYDTPGGLSYNKLVNHDGSFYLGYEDLASRDIYVAKSQDLYNWEDPVVAGQTPQVDFVPDLCVGQGRIWVVWNYFADGRSHLMIVSSEDGVTWTEGTEIPTGSDVTWVFGPYSLIWDKGKFIFVTRMAPSEVLPVNLRHWRMMMAISSDGYTWSPFEQVSEPQDVDYYWEKGGTIFPLTVGRNSGYAYSVVFKRTIYDSVEDQLEYERSELCQVLLNI